MAYNPFLDMYEPAPAAQDPLKMSEGEAAQDTFGINDSSPFGGSGGNPFAASNPFSDFGGGEYEPPAGDTVPVDIFGTVEPTGIGAKHFEGFETNTNVDLFTNQAVKPTELDLISTTTDTFPVIEHDGQQLARVLPQETQNLILSVTGQMEFTSSHLLDRIPPTRTPSPVSVRDIHSPSPTPEPDLFEESQQAESLASAPAPPATTAKPTRPPPARPPPVARPPPPRPAPPPVPQQPHRPPPPAQATDEINLFDAPVPVPVKPTKEAIMSLYSAPKKEEKQIDFLSDDILDSMSTDAVPEASPVSAPESAPVPPVSMASETVLSGDITPKAAVPVETFDTTFPQTASSPTNQVPMDCSEPSREAVPTTSNTSPFADVNINNFQLKSNDNNEKESNPFENMGEVDDPGFDAHVGENIFNVSSAEDTAMTPEPLNNNIFGLTNNDAFTSPVAKEVPTTRADLFPTTQDVFADERSNNAFSTADDDMFGGAGTGAGGESVAAVDPGWGTVDNSDAMMHEAFPESQDAFDAFSAKFDSTTSQHAHSAAWGDDAAESSVSAGFEAEAFDPFLNMGAPPPPAATPRLDHQGSRDSTDDSFNVFIRPKDSEASGEGAAVPVLAPPPRPHAVPESPRVNPFDKSGFELPREDPQMDESRRDSGGETPPTPLFDEDMSMPLEDFPRTKYDGPGWEMYLRQPNKKKITGQRFWKKVFVRLATVGEAPAVQLFQAATDKEPFQELPLQACYSVSDIAAQQFDQFGKIFTVKLQYVFYKERPGVRPGQVTKAERITNKLSQFAAYAIQGDYQGVKEFGSDLKKLGLPVEHAPQVSQLFKLGSLSYEDVKQLSVTIEEALFRLPAHRDRALTYKMEEVQITAVDELYVEQDAEGSVLKQIARVRLFFLGFLSGMPDVELGVNDLRRQGKEVVGRHDIIPVVTEEWIRVEAPEFHACVTPQDFQDTQIIKFKPPDACYIELMRFRIRPPKNRELPLQLKAVWCVTGNKVELRADVLVPGFASRKLGQVPCEDVSIRFPIPECWIYLFRVEKHFRYGSVKSAHRRTGKIKGIERFLGAVDTLQESLIEVTSGQAKYEHQHRAIVWRMPRLPKEGQGAYTSHNLVCRMALTSYDQVPAQLAPHAFVEFTMPAAVASHVTARSVSLQNHDGDPPEKYVRYLARHEYTVGIERTSGSSAPAYSVAAKVEASTPPAPAPAPAAPAVPQPPSSDSDSD